MNSTAKTLLLLSALCTLPLLAFGCSKNTPEEPVPAESAQPVNTEPALDESKYPAYPTQMGTSATAEGVVYTMVEGLGTFNAKPSEVSYDVPGKFWMAKSEPFAAGQPAVTYVIKLGDNQTGEMALAGDTMTFFMGDGSQGKYMVNGTAMVDEMNSGTGTLRMVWAGNVTKDGVGPAMPGEGALVLKTILP